VKGRHAYPAGQTSASKIKALLSYVEAREGTKAADAWLAEVRLARADLDDETRLLPLGALRASLEAFERGRHGSLEDVGPHFVGSENLGVWARVLRGMREPQHAFARVDASDSEHGRTTRWETTSSGPGVWRGRVRIGHDPALEKDGLLARARAVELSMVPVLFGYPRAAVRPGPVTEDAQEFEVRWSLPSPSRSAVMFGVAGAIGGSASLVALPPSLGALVALAAGALGAGVGFATARGDAARIDRAAQAARVDALERSLALRDSEGRSGTGELEGTVVAGQYRIGARMGAGASGVIYEAARLTDGMPVAIKLLRAATAHDAVASDRLRREAEALGLSWHPNVVEVIDHGHLPDGTSYLVMELLEGEPLATRLQNKGRLDLEELQPIALQIADALVAIHAAGVVHRDLKPANIYLRREEDGSDRAKILDFGIARVEWEEMRITNLGAPLGTPGYMSPEQESGGEIDARSDVFAAGAVLYECLVGEPPPPERADFWSASPSPTSGGLRLPPEGLVTPADSGVHPASRRFPSVAASAPAVRVDVPDAWRRIVERALAKRPEERFQDARSLLTALRALPASSGPANSGGGESHAAP
jgi:serine/threonine-protein kinase